ncbi:MAG TPA: TlpA disulfide reductase family protein [Terriglobia bacterium]|nr:TlpA disulfide reductase family protein [Terriglobia bacterium]
MSRVLLFIGLALVVGAIFVYHFSPQFQPGPKSASPQPGANPGVNVPAPAVPAIRGKPVAAFDLPDLNGRRYTPADFQGKVLLVNFWATWCGPCLIEIPWFLEFKERYGPEGFEVLAISMDEEGAEVVKPFVEKHKMQSLTVVLGEASTPDLFGGLLGFPTTFLVDREGKYYSKHMGLVSKEDVEDEILTLLHPPGSSEAATNEAAESRPVARSSAGSGAQP